MQEVHPAGSATPTPAVIGFTDRRHTHTHHHPTTAAPALKCPRCDSLNTKFCYYNNYNLSQPRHFCKNCRRYWTNGGVLRNVPVGGGSRKSSKPKPKHKPKLKPKPNISSTTNTEGNGNGNGNGVVLSHAAQKQDEVLTCANPNPNPETLAFDGPLVPATVSFGEIMQTEETKVQGILAGEVGADQTVRIEDFVQSREGDGGVVALDWQGSDSSGFGLGLIDDQSYWSQATTTSFDDRHLQNQQQWFDDHHSNATSDNNYLPLFLP